MWNIFILLKKKFQLLQNVSTLVLISLFLCVSPLFSSPYKNGRIYLKSRKTPNKISKTPNFICFSIHMKSYFSLHFANKSEGSQENFKTISFFSQCLSLTLWWCWWKNMSCSSLCWWNPIKDHNEKENFKNASSA